MSQSTHISLDLFSMQSDKFEISDRELGILNNMLNYLCHAIPFDNVRMKGTKEEFQALLAEIRQLDAEIVCRLDFEVPKLGQLQTAFRALEYHLKGDPELSCVIDEPGLVWGLRTRLDEFARDAT